MLPSNKSFDNQISYYTNLLHFALRDCSTIHVYQVALMAVYSLDSRTIKIYTAW